MVLCTIRAGRFRRNRRRVGPPRRACVYSARPGLPERPQVMDVLVDVGIEDLLEAGGRAWSAIRSRPSSSPAARLEQLDGVDAHHVGRGPGGPPAGCRSAPTWSVETERPATV